MSSISLVWRSSAPAAAAAISVSPSPRSPIKNNLLMSPPCSSSTLPSYSLLGFLIQFGRSDRFSPSPISSGEAPRFLSLSLPPSHLMSGADLPKMGEEEEGKITRQGGEEAPSLCEGLVFSNTSLRSDPRRGRGNRIYLLESCFSSENLHVVVSWIVLVR